MTKQKYNIYKYYRPQWRNFISTRSKDFFERVATHDSIVISQHGFSAAMFTDPVFADLAGPHAERRTLAIVIYNHILINEL
jgi:hypothetical protein